MNLKTCDSCGETVGGDAGGDVFFAVKMEISQGTTWGPAQVAAAGRMAREARRSGMKALADALEAGEPAEIDSIPCLVTRVNLRICLPCLTTGRPSVTLPGWRPGMINVLDLVRASHPIASARPGSDH